MHLKTTWIIDIYFSLDFILVKHFIINYFGPFLSVKSKVIIYIVTATSRKESSFDSKYFLRINEFFNGPN